MRVKLGGIRTDGDSLNERMLDDVAPLILVGTGRCGSTLLHRVLARHPSANWLTQTCERHPARPELNRVALGLADLPLLGRTVRRRLDPAEAYALWGAHCGSFVAPFRDLEASDLTPRARRRLRAVFSSLLTHRRPRLLLKVTGWPRIGFLQALLPRARFVHVYRDGRAVANSYLSVDWWSGWRGPANWAWGELTPDQRARWERSDRSFAALAGLNWELLMDAHRVALEKLASDDYMEIRYEDLCSNPIAVTRSITDFAGLEWSIRYERQIASLSYRNANDKWRRDLGELESAALEDTIMAALARYGYAVGTAG
jgi:hypothetical protein